MKKKSKAFLPVLLLPSALALFYAGGILAQFIRHVRAWKLTGSDFRVSPGLPSLRIADIAAAVFSFPEGLISLLLLSAAAALAGLFFLRPGAAGTDLSRNLTISRSGTFGTAGFMSRAEIAGCCEISAPADTDLDILGMSENGKVVTLSPASRLNGNWAVCGASGTGKSRCVSRNLILQAAERGESVIVTDCKGELYESTGEYLRAQGYTVKIFNLIDMTHSDSWNCLGEIRGDELMAQTFADVVLANTGGESKDSFWNSAELNLLKALVLYVSCDMPPEKRSFAQVYDMLTGATAGSLERTMSKVSRARTDGQTGEVLPPSPAWIPYSLFRQASEAVRSGVIIGLGSKLQVMQAQAVKDITTYDDIDLELPGRQKCAYFCIVSDQDSTFSFLSSLFFSFLFIRLIRYADAQGRNGMLEPNVRFILDEFTNCCRIPDFTKKASTIRSRGCSFAAFFQNIGQMRNRYPNDQWQEILGACDTTVFLGCTDLLTAEYFSSRAGIASVETECTGYERSAARPDGSAAVPRRAGSVSRRPLLTPDEILRMDPDEELVFIRGKKVMKLKRFDYSLHPQYRKLRPAKACTHVPKWIFLKPSGQPGPGAANAAERPAAKQKSTALKSASAQESAPAAQSAPAAAQSLNGCFTHVEVEHLLKKGR